VITPSYWEIKNRYICYSVISLFFHSWCGNGRNGSATLCCDRRFARNGCRDCNWRFGLAVYQAAGSTWSSLQLLPTDFEGLSGIAAVAPLAVSAFVIMCYLADILA
jgi:hypothetical protein